VRFGAGGLRFSAGPDEALLESERTSLERLDPEPDASGPAFEIDLVPDPPWTSDDRALFPQWEPAVQRWVGGRLLVSHRSFVAEIDPFAARARLQRREPRAYPLEAVIRTALLARLPLVGGLPLHAGAVVLGGRGVAFFGPSGAGKTTLAATAPVPVLSDELVAIAPDRPLRLVRSGFWGAAPAGSGVAGGPLALLVDLKQGPAFRLEPLRPVAAAGRLLASVPVPLVPAIWQRALAVVAEVVAQVPVARMEWAPEAPPWQALQAFIDARAEPPGADDL
jgi:hypothetical protein